jgi:hypothetical protein
MPEFVHRFTSLIKRPLPEHLATLISLELPSDFPPVLKARQMLKVRQVCANIMESGGRASAIDCVDLLNPPAPPPLGKAEGDEPMLPFIADVAEGNPPT